MEITEGGSGVIPATATSSYISAFSPPSKKKAVTDA